MLSETELAWAAGFWDGEGHVRFRIPNGCQIGIGQTDKAPLERFAKAVEEEGSFYFYDRSKRYSSKKKDFWLLQFTTTDKIKRIYEKLKPYLCQPKIKQFEEVFMCYDRYQEVLKERERFCKRGHLLEGENLYTYPGGQRMCRTCRKIWTDKYSLR